MKSRSRPEISSELPSPGSDRRALASISFIHSSPTRQVMTWGLLKPWLCSRLVRSALWLELPQVQVGHGLGMAGSPVAVVGTEKGSCRLGRTTQDHRGGKEAPVK